jgi:uncharacterized protein (TIGR02246 family)
MDGMTVKAWLDKYQEAWRTDDPKLIRQLFTEDAVYVTAPYDTPWQGIGQIVKGWTELSDSGVSWEFRYGIVCMGEEIAVIQGWTTYPASETTPLREYSNIWLIWFEPDGRAREFREWWMEKPEVSGPSVLG